MDKTNIEYKLTAAVQPLALSAFLKFAKALRSVGRTRFNNLTGPGNIKDKINNEAIERLNNKAR